MANLSSDQVFRRLATELVALLRSTTRATTTTSPSQSSRWQRWVESTEVLRKISVNLTVILVAVVLVAVTGKVAFEPVADFRPIRVPAEYAARGYDGTVVSERIIARMHEIGRQAETRKEGVSIGAKPRYEALAAVKVPSSSLNLQVVVTLIRELFNADDVEVAGDLTISPAKNGALNLLQLRYRTGGRKRTVNVSGTNLDELVDTAAEALLSQVDPYILASYFYGVRKWKEMDRVINQILEESPKSFDAKWALNLRGNRHRDLEKYDQAIYYYERAIKIDLEVLNPILAAILNPRRMEMHAIVYSNWGITLSDLKQYERAVVMFQQAIDINPRSSFALVGWGDLLREKEDYEGAIAKYERATAIDPKNSDALRGVGIVLRQKKDYEGAMAKFERAAEINPNSPFVFTSWGNLFHDMGDYEGAIAKYKKALELSPDNLVALRNLSVVLRKTGDEAGAAEALRRASALSR